MKKLPVVLLIFSMHIVGHAQSVLGKFKDKVKNRLGVVKQIPIHHG